MGLGIMRGRVKEMKELQVICRVEEIQQDSDNNSRNQIIT